MINICEVFLTFSYQHNLLFDIIRVCLVSSSNSYQIKRQEHKMLAFCQGQNLSLFERKTRTKFILQSFQLRNTKTMTLDLLGHSKTKTPILFFVTVEIIFIAAPLRPSLLHHFVTPQHLCCPFTKVFINQIFHVQICIGELPFDPPRS